MGGTLVRGRRPYGQAFLPPPKSFFTTKSTAPHFNALRGCSTANVRFGAFLYANSFASFLNTSSSWN
jgi:hypothetical protein